MKEIFFCRLLVICEKHGINLSDVSQFYLNGTVFKTVKPKLFNEIEKDLQHHSMPVSSGAYRYDKMWLIQQLEQHHNTFG